MPLIDYISYPDFGYHYLKESGLPIIFDVAIRDWMPSVPELHFFCYQLIWDIIDRYKQIEATQEHTFSQEILYAIDKEGKQLANVGGMGGTESEIASTHALEWELVELLREYKKEPRTFNFGFIAVGKNPPNRQEIISPNLILPRELSPSLV